VAVLFDKNGEGVTGTAPAGGLFILGQLLEIPGEGGLIYSGKGFAGWTTRPDGGGDRYKPGQVIPVLYNLVLYAQWADVDKTFRAQSAVDNSWYTVKTKKLAEGSSCVVYGDILEGISAATAAGIAAEYDGKIHGPITGAFGNIYYMPNNSFAGADKVILLLLDIKDGYAGSGGYVAGYFDFTHMYSSFENSNEAAMLFLDVNPGTAGGEEFYSTIAHELQHLINYSQTAALGKNSKNLWIDEGLSSGAEYIYGGHQESRIAYFNADPQETIVYGNNFFVWDGFWEEERGDVLANYATVYLFFQWLRIHAGGVGIYKAIVDASESDYRAVTGAAAAIDPKFNNWEPLLSTWMLANVYSGTAPATGSNRFYGYRGEIKTTAHGFKNTGKEDWPFSPGEGIFSEMNGPFTPPGDSGAHIRYRGFRKPETAIAVDESGPSYEGDILLTFNADSNYKSSDEKGYLADTRGDRPEILRLSAGSGVTGDGVTADNLPAFPETYPLSFREMAAGLGNPNPPKIKPFSAIKGSGR
jgi:hypothetical protein